jgi:hypothetical protein
MTQFDSEKTVFPLSCRWSLVFSLLFLFVLLAHSVPPKGLHGWILTHWALDYKFGIIPRALIGTIHQAIFGKVSSSNVYWVYITLLLALFTFIIWWVTLLLERHHNRSGTVSLIFLTIVLFVPYQITVNMAGRFDLFLIIVFLGFVFLIRTRFRLLAPLLCVLGVAIHETFLVFFTPACFVIAIYDPENDHFRLRDLILPALTVFASVTTYFLLISNIPRVYPLNVFIGHVQSNSEFNVTSEMIRQEYKWGLLDHFRNSQRRFGNPYVRFHILISLFVFSPFLGLFAKFWKSVFSSISKKGTYEVFLKNLMLLSVFSPLSLIFIGTDYWRWLMMTIFLFFFYVFYFERIEPRVFRGFVEWVEWGGPQSLDSKLPILSSDPDFRCPM